METKERLEQIFRDVFDDDGLNISDEMIIADIERWDSFMHVQLVIAIEEAFGVKFEIAEAVKFKDIGDIRRMLEEKIAANTHN
ncbi:MAG: acyl carrier protein [Nitrospirae bacterium]|nr:acyl carrier protein [Nitrospirota bacterium]